MKDNIPDYAYSDNGFLKQTFKTLSILILSFFVLSITSIYGHATSVLSWDQNDIGQANLSGNVIENQGLITLQGSGNDIWGSADDFYFVYIPVEGDISIQVRVLSVEYTHAWAKGALMMREDLSSGSVNVALDYSAHNHVALQWRPVANQRSYYWGRPVGDGSVWLKLERTGNNFSGYYSLDGENWTLTTTKTLSMNQSFYVGIAASPHVSDQNNEVVMDNLSLDSANGSNLCQAQGAQCGSITLSDGSQFQCGLCGNNQSCSQYQCQAIDSATIAQTCSTAGASCGAIRDGLGNTLNCGGCDSGASCSNNRCEASCSLEQIAEGSFDGIVAYLPLQFAQEDLSGNQHNVTTTLLPTDRSAELFPFESEVDLKDKMFSLDLGNTSINGPMTISFKTQPDSNGQSATLLNNAAIKVTEDNGTLKTVFSPNTAAITLSNTQSQFKHRSCNHVALQIDDQSVRSFFNGHETQTGLSPVALESISGTLDVGPYEGKIWDIRLFDRALTSEEVAGLGSDCDDANSKTVPDPAYPNYLCGVYQCIYWPDGVTDTTQESFDYQLSGHEMTWEHNVMNTGMYVHGELCAEYDKPRDLLLTDGYRNAWVNKFNFDKPWNQYVLHENFHAYQSRTGGSTKFLAESSASWGAFAQKPTAYDTILGMYTLQPQLALWTTQSSVFEDGIIDYAKGGHQYGASIWEWYVTHYVLDANFIGEVFNRNRLGLAPLTGAPAEGMYNALAQRGYDMREIFADFAARITTWDVDYADTFIASEIGSFNRMNNNNNNSDNPIPSEEVNNKIAEFYDVTGTQGNWLTVPSRYKIGAWAFNAYEVDVTQNQQYDIGIAPSTSNPSYVEFRAQVVVHNPTTGERTYHKLPITSAGNSSNIQVYAEAGSKLYLVVSSTPSTKFTEFEAYTYDYRIATN